MKNRKSPRMDDSTGEMIKYGGEKLYAEKVKLMKSIFIKSQIPIDGNQAFSYQFLRSMIEWT